VTQFFPTCEQVNTGTCLPGINESILLVISQLADYIKIKKSLLWDLRIGPGHT
jgi:hypothetical protein